ncbi:MAG: 30S ribosomal protein S6 [Alphaproteobacteria bacterium]|nr:30S ribosomal protein S6 [Alphaproteobacteria bacterium]
MPLYESTFIMRPDITAQQVEALTQQFTDLIKAQGGSVPKTEYWGLKSLSYRLKKNRKGHYSYLQIDGPPVAVAEFERNMRINEDVIRYLTVKVESHEAGPSAMMQARNARDDRGGSGGRGGRGRDDRGFGDDRPRRYDEPRDGDLMDSGV